MIYLNQAGHTIQSTRILKLLQLIREDLGAVQAASDHASFPLAGAHTRSVSPLQYMGARSATS